MKTALITGITGQDGSYLAELLLSKGYTVYGIQRPSSSINTGRIDHIYDRLKMRYCDVAGGGEQLKRLLVEIRPDEIYNLAAQSHVQVSFQMPEDTERINVNPLYYIYDTYRNHLSEFREVKLYQASSSEMFGNAATPTQYEGTGFDPCSPYGKSKVQAFNKTCQLRNTKRFAVNGILFNHTSERQKETFVVRKITTAAARIKLGQQRKLFLGNLEGKRDFGYAPDYVEAIWLMMQQDKADDYVIATGQQYSVSEILDETFGYLGLNWTDHVEVDPKYYRPTELHSLCGDASKAKRVLGWEPKTGFKEIVRKMVDYDLLKLHTANQGQQWHESLLMMRGPERFDERQTPAERLGIVRRPTGISGFNFNE